MYGCTYIHTPYILCIEITNIPKVQREWSKRVGERKRERAYTYTKRQILQNNKNSNTNSSSNNNIKIHFERDGKRKYERIGVGLEEWEEEKKVKHTFHNKHLLSISSSMSIFGDLYINNTLFGKFQTVTVTVTVTNSKNPLLI